MATTWTTAGATAMTPLKQRRQKLELADTMVDVVIAGAVDTAMCTWQH